MNSRQDDFSEQHLRGFHEADLCLHCREHADRHHPVGPITITITISEPDDCGEFATYVFCEWRCLAAWISTQAGGVFVYGLN
jgi:hypothetical protein